MPIYKTGKVKDGKQQYRVIVCYTDNLGKYKQVTKCVYGLAEAKLTEMELQHKVEEGNTPTGMTLQQLYDEYIESVSHEIRESTMRQKKGRSEHHILPTMKKTKLSKLNTTVLQQWKNEISAKKLSLNTKKSIYKEFSALLNYGVKTERLKSNPLSKLGNFKDPNNFDKAEDKIHYYTAEQFKSFISAAKNHLTTLADYGYYTFFMIAFYTGMRKGEINALRWCDIDGNILSVNRSVDQKLKGQGCVFTPPKSLSSVRKLQIPANLAAVLEVQKKKQQDNTQRWNEEFLVCGGINCLSDTGISNRNIQYAKEAGLEPIRIHDFRHTHATLLINEGINIQEIARRLGHSDVNITWKVYAHLYPREEERAIKVLEAI